MIVTVACATGSWRSLPRGIAVPGVAFLAWMALAAALGEDGRFAWLGIPQRHSGWLLLLICAALACSGASMVAVADGAVAAGVLWLPALVAGAADAAGWATGEGRLLGTFGSAAYLGAAATVVLPIAAGVAADAGRARWWRATAAVAATVALYAGLGSGSRAAWLGLAGAAAVAGLAIRGRRRLLAARTTETLDRRPRIVVFVLAGCVSATIALAAATTPLGSRVGSLVERGASTSAGEAGDLGGVSRLDEWAVAVRVIANRPMLGAGPEGYRLVAHEGIDADYARAYGREVQPDRAHNVFLDTAAAGGVPAALALVALWLGIGMVLWRHRHALMPEPMAVGAVAASAGYALQQQFLFPLAEVDPVVWLLLGGLVGTLRQQTVAVGTAAAPVRRLAWLHVASAGVAAAAVAAAVWFGVRDIAAWRAAAEAVAADARGDAVLAHEAALDAVEWRSDEVWLHLLLSRLALTSDEAMAAADGALALSPADPIALLRRAELLTTIDPTAAATELDVLLHADPHHATLHLLRGTAAIRVGDEQTAEREWLRALDLAPGAAGPRANLIRLYRQQGRDEEAAALEAAALDPVALEAAALEAAVPDAGALQPGPVASAEVPPSLVAGR